jgi:hypothetical protein
MIVKPVMRLQIMRKRIKCPDGTFLRLLPRHPTLLYADNVSAKREPDRRDGREIPIIGARVVPRQAERGAVGFRIRFIPKKVEAAAHFKLHQLG